MKLEIHFLCRVITSKVFFSHVRLLDRTGHSYCCYRTGFPSSHKWGDSHDPSRILNDSKQEKTVGLHLQWGGAAYSSKHQEEQNFICQWQPSQSKGCSNPTNEKSPYFLEWTLDVKVKSLSRVRLFVTPWTVAHQAPPSMEFSRQSTEVGCHFLLQGIFLTQGSNLRLPHCRQMLYHLSHQGSSLDIRVPPNPPFSLKTLSSPSLLPGLPVALQSSNILNCNSSGYSWINSLLSVLLFELTTAPVCPYFGASLVAQW